MSRDFPQALWSILIPALLLCAGCAKQSQTSPSSNSPAATPTRSITPAAQSSVKAESRATDWPAFRGPTGMGISSASGMPATWSETKNIAWKTPLPGAGASSPIVFGDRIYLAAYTGFFVPGEPGGSPEELKRHLLAINRDDGKIVWDKAVPAKLPEESSIRDHGFAASSAAADSERIYVFFGKTGVFAFDHDGNQLWQADVGERTHGWGSSASPVLFDDLVFINASVESDSLIALDRATGKEKWRADGIQESWSTPVMVTANSGRQELVVATKGSVQAFDPKTGEQLWTCRTDIGWYMVPGVVADKGIVYCLGGRSGIAALAVKAGGTGDVTESLRLWTTTKGANVPSPVVLENHLYWPHESGIANCAKVENGELVYQERLERSDTIYASTLLADGKLYYLARNGRTFVVAAKPEFEQLGMNDLNDGGIFNATPVPNGSRLLIRSDKFLYCIGK